MTTDMSQRKLIDKLVDAMLAHVTGLGIDLRKLAADPAAIIETVDEIVLTWVDPATLTGNCSVAALYIGQEHPPRILVARDTSPGRRAFSTLHEFGHHLRDRVDAVTDVFWELPDGGASIEEDLVDAFAAAVLLPANTIANTFANGVDAAAVVELWRATSASREASCVAAARVLPAPGYVMLLDPGGRCQFAARNGDVYAIRRGTSQTAAKLGPALRGGTARGVDRPTFHSGVASSQMHVDATAAGQYIFAVWVTDSPSWDAPHLCRPVLPSMRHVRLRHGRTPTAVHSALRSLLHGAPIARVHWSIDHLQRALTGRMWTPGSPPSRHPPSSDRPALASASASRSSGPPCTAKPHDVATRRFDG
jgi:hypothetical protein